MTTNVMTRRGEPRGLLGWPQGPHLPAKENLRLRVKCDAKGRSQLDLSHRGLAFIPLHVFQFQQLDTLNLSHNNLDNLPPMISYLRGIRTLYLQHNLLTALPPTLVNLRHLSELDLTQNSLVSLPKGLGGLRVLKVLKLGNNQMEQIPHELGNLRNLRVVDLHGNRLWYLPFSLQNLYLLLRLDISDNLFDQIPLVVTKLTWLRALDVSANRLASLPPDFDQMRELRELNLSENRFVALGVMATKLRQIKYLSLAHNRLVSVPGQIVRLKNLRVLHLQGNCLDALPDEFPRLKYLNIAENKLSYFSVLRMGELVALDASGNHLESLPRGVFGLKNLQRMNMARNKIIEIPEDIGWLRKLQSLDLSDNDLHSLPAALHFMEKLTSFNVRGNPNISRFPIPPAQHGKDNVKAEDWFRPSSAITASHMNDKKKKASKVKDANQQRSNLRQHQSVSMPSLHPLTSSRKDYSSQLMSKSKGSLWPQASTSHQDRTWLDNFLFSKHHPRRRASWDSITHHKSATLRSKAKSVPYPLDDRFEMGEIRASFSAESICSSSSSHGKRFNFDDEASVGSFNSDDNDDNVDDDKEEQDSALEVSFSSDDSHQHHINNGGTHLGGSDWLLSYSKKAKPKIKQNSVDDKKKKKKKKTKTPSKKSAIFASNTSINKSAVNFSRGNGNDKKAQKKMISSTTTIGNASNNKNTINKDSSPASAEQTERKTPYHISSPQLGIYNYYHQNDSEAGEGSWEPRQMNILRTNGSTSRATSHHSTKDRSQSKPTSSSTRTQVLKSDSNWTMRSHFSEPLTVQTWTQTVPEGLSLNANAGTQTQSAEALRGSRSSFLTGIRSASSPQMMRMMTAMSDPLWDNNFELRQQGELGRSPSPIQPSLPSSSLLHPSASDNHTNFSPVTNIDSHHSFEPGHSRDLPNGQSGTTDYTLLGVCSQAQTLLHRDLLQPVIGFNGQRTGRFSNKTIRCGDNGTWHYGYSGTGSTQGEWLGGLEAGLEYSPGETFTTTERGGHYVSAFCPHVQVSVPPGATNRSLHVTLQQLTISSSVLKVISDADTYVSNIISCGPVVFLNALEKVTFNSPVTLTLPAPARVKGHKSHLVVMSVRHDNTCVPCTTAYQSSKSEVTLTTWHMTGKVAVLTKAKCKYKACKSMEQLLATLNIMALNATQT